jgi:hypothetical protein
MPKKLKGGEEVPIPIPDILKTIGGSSVVPEAKVTAVPSELAGGKRKGAKGRKVRGHRGGEGDIEGPPLETSGEAVMTTESSALETPPPQLEPIVLDEAPNGADAQTGGKKHKKYKGRDYVVRTGSKGGKYILVKGKKVYV